jgi:hypothetical protein
MIVKAIITYSDATEATFVGQPLNLVEIPLLSPAQQYALNAPAPVETVQAEVDTTPGQSLPGVVDDAVVEAPEVPIEVTPDETAPTEAAPTE